MSDIVPIVHSRNELDSLIKNILGTTSIQHSTENNTKCNESIQPANQAHIYISDFSEFLDFCYYRSFRLLANSINNNTSLSTEQRSAALTLSRDLMLSFPILDYLVISSLYTVRYLLNDSYMRLDEYVYFSSFSESSQSFLNVKFLNETTDISRAIRINNLKATNEISATKSSYKTHIKLHRIIRTGYKIRPKIKKRKNNKSETTETKEEKEIQYILSLNKDIPFDSDFNQSLTILANNSLKSHYKYLFDYDTIQEPNGKSYVIRLFMPTYVLLFSDLIKSRQTEREKDENKFTRLKKLKHSGIKIPPQQRYYDQLLPPQPAQKLMRDIKQALTDTENTYQFMVGKMKEDLYYKDHINETLYLYKLSRVFPIQYLRTILTPSFSSNFNKDFILILNKIPDISIRSALYTKSYHKFRGFKLCDFDRAIDCIFPDIEKLFFAMLTSKYSLECLDKYLQLYSKKEIEDQLNNATSDSSNTTSKKLFDTNQGLFHTQNSHDTFLRNILTIDDSIPLNKVFEIFVKNFHYENIETILGLVNRLNLQAGTIEYDRFPITIHNKSDFWTFMNMYLKLPPDQNNHDSVSHITTRTELILDIAEILNHIVGID